MLLGRVIGMIVGYLLYSCRGALRSHNAEHVVVAQRLHRGVTNRSSRPMRTTATCRGIEWRAGSRRANRARAVQHNPVEQARKAVNQLLTSRRFSSSSGLMTASPAGMIRD